MKVAVIQIDAQNNKEKNIEKTLSLTRKAIRNKAKFILLPEAFSFQGLPKAKTLRSVAEDIPGESTAPFMELAKKYKVHICAGSVCEKIKGSNKVYNTSVFISDQGKIKGKYRKINLFNAVIGRHKIKESDRIQAGRQLACVKASPFKVGLTICYDLRFGELFQRYRKARANIICVPSAFTAKTGQDHWETLLRARAIENLCYIIAPNQCGDDGRGVLLYGNSMIIDPWGKVLARATMRKEGIIYAHVSKGEIEKKKKALPGIRR